MDGDWKVKSILPLCPGHEGVGVVHEVGAEVTNLKVGDRVGIAWMNRACGSCEYCISGWETLCDQQVLCIFLFLIKYTIRLRLGLILMDVCENTPSVMTIMP
jgi:D-arabinose 1-dehydrogenase-like Zn-dependent alcohol dehydrogenase